MIIIQEDILKMKLNLGCGRDYREGWTNVDISTQDIYGNKILVDINHDLNSFPYPFEDNCADIILLDNVLEHLDDISRVMEELYRILKVKGKLKIIVPHFSSWNSFTDPSHKHWFSIQMASRKNFINNLILNDQELILSTNPILKLFNPIININPQRYEGICFGIFNPIEIRWIFTK